MSESITIVVEIEPRGKGTPRFFAMPGAGIRSYPDEKTRIYEGTLAAYARAAMKDRPPFPYAVRIDICAHMVIPPSWPFKKREAARSGRLRPTVKPDWDNISKAIGDAFNKIIWNDDCQVVHATVSKRYGETPKLVIVVEPIEDAAAEFDPEARRAAQPSLAGLGVA